MLTTSCSSQSAFIDIFHFPDDGGAAHDPRHPAGGLPGLRPHPAVAVPAGAPHGQVLPAVHLLDRGRLGVQTHRPGRGDQNEYITKQIRECAIYKFHHQLEQNKKGSFLIC